MLVTQLLSGVGIFPMLLVTLIQRLDLGAPIDCPGVLLRPHVIIRIDTECLGSM